MNNMADLNRRKRSYDAHVMDTASHAYPGSMGVPPAPYQWHEMDYTQSTMDAPRFAPTSAPVQYAPPGMTAFSPVDYSRHDYPYTAPYSEHDGSVPPLPHNMYRVGPFRYAELAHMDGDTASLSQESIYSRSTRLHSLTDSERRDSQPGSILSNNDMRRESEGYERLFPITSIDSENCRRDSNNPEQPCLDLSHLGAIEECAPPDCMALSPQYMTAQPPSKPNQTQEHETSIHSNHSGVSSPTTLAFQDPTAADNAKLRPRRGPRPRSANSDVADKAAHEKASKLRARQAHSLVERKYRDNLNLKISQLHHALQTTRFGPSPTSPFPAKELKTDYFDDEPMVSPELPTEKSSTGSTPTGSKVRKSDVLTDAMNYVTVAEAEMKRMSEEIMNLTAQLKSMEKSARCENCALLKQMVTLQVEGNQAEQRQPESQG